MTFSEFEAYCLSKPGVSDNYPFKGETVWMKVGDKMFALANVKPLKVNQVLVEPFHFVNLKCDPDRSIELRQQYRAVQPGWHQSKTHWNSVIIDGSLPDHMIYELIDHSYDLVFNSLNSKTKEAIQNGQ